MGRHSLPDPDDNDRAAPDEGVGGGSDRTPGPPPRTIGSAHSGDWEGGEWTGSHRAITPRRRGCRIGVIVALVSVVVVVGAVILWRFFGDALSNRSDTAAARCVEGEVAVAVIADPAIAAPVADLAQRYNETAEPVGDKCVKVEVQPADSDQVVNGLIGDLARRPRRPPGAVDSRQLGLGGPPGGQAGAQTVSDSRSLVTSPVVLAVSPRLKGALGEQNWGTLPRLQTDPAGLDGLGLQGWGGAAARAAAGPEQRRVRISPPRRSRLHRHRPAPRRAPASALSTR